MERPNNSGIAIIEWVEKKTPRNGTPVNAVAATGTLTISGVVKNGETITLGGEVYEINSAKDKDGVLIPSGNIDVDISEAATLKYSKGTLTVDTTPTAGDTMTVGTKTYTFRSNGTTPLADGDIELGTGETALADTQAAIVAAINGTDGVNDANTLAWAADFATNASVITAIIGGTSGNSIATTETFTAGTNVFDAATLGTTQAGVDATNAEGATAIEAAIDAESALFTASKNVGVVTVTYATKGVIGNDVATTETMANGAFGAAVTSGGVNGTVGEQWETYSDSSYLYYAIADNTIADANWRRIALGSAY